MGTGFWQKLRKHQNAGKPTEAAPLGQLYLMVRLIYINLLKLRRTALFLSLPQKTF